MNMSMVESALQFLTEKERSRQSRESWTKADSCFFLQTQTIITASPYAFSFAEGKLSLYFSMISSAFSYQPFLKKWQVSSSMPR